jgi:hypothetical protein
MAPLPYVTVIAIPLTCIKQAACRIGILVRVWAAANTGVAADVQQKAPALSTLRVAGAFVQEASLQESMGPCRLKTLSCEYIKYSAPWRPCVHDR